MVNNKDISLIEVLQNNKNDNRYPCIELVSQFKKALNLEGLKYVNAKNESVSSEKVYNVKNENDLYDFYKDNLQSDNMILNKSETSKILNVSISTIGRLNDKLKEKGLLYRNGNNLYLTEGGEVNAK